MDLIIVESPTKAKTISKFLGKKYKVTSSFGHIRDLPKNKMGVDIEHDFEPEYVIPPTAKTRVTELKKIASDADDIILATDEDREGEAIAWHLAHILKLPVKSAKRIVFHEITKNALEKALENPRALDIRLIDAQQARRVLDRLVGYELSPFLWDKVKRGLSAGRVQSVVVRFIAEREREIEKFTSEEYWTLDTKFSPASESAEIFDATLIERDGKKVEQAITLELFAGPYTTKKSIFPSQKSIDDVVTDLKKSEFKVSSIEEKEMQRTPPPPFTTSSLQQAAINSLGFSAKQTMQLAQKLYEEGLITYMRTDSVNLSLDSLVAAKKTIDSLFGKEYSLESPRYYKSKSKGAQEAHEAIRPSDPTNKPEDLKKSTDPRQAKLYRLIWNRMVACQMQPARVRSVRIDISAIGKSGDTFMFRAKGSTIIFDGFLAVAGKSSTGDIILPPIKEGDLITCHSLVPQQKSTTPPPRYTEASIVKILEEFGIGRPSTYAPTISTVIEREYVEKNEDKRLVPLDMGFLVNDILTEHFPEIVDPHFTAELENDLDEIAEGNKKWAPVIRSFYEPFHKNLESKNKKVKREDLLEKIGRNCPECKNDLVMRFGRFGKFIACSNYPTCRYTEKTEAEKKVDEENKGEVCDKCSAPMVVKRGRFGAFLGCSNYPDCKNLKKIETKLGITCPKCNKGDIVERKSKKGRVFFGCNSYPKCDFALWSKPTGETCPKCKSLLVFGPKGTMRCSEKECGYSKVSSD